MATDRLIVVEHEDDGFTAVGDRGPWTRLRCYEVYRMTKVIEQTWTVEKWRTGVHAGFGFSTDAAYADLLRQEAEAEKQEDGILPPVCKLAIREAGSKEH